MLRQREFNMAEGEFFFDPEDPEFAPFTEYENMGVRLVPNTDPENTISTTLGEAVGNGTICSQVLAHFMGVTLTFATDIGIPEGRMRFREHLSTEMAHYARDCWDLEVETSSGWIEMVGIADRSAYDLNQHTKGSGQDLVAKRRFPEPINRRVTTIEVDLKELGPIFRSRARSVADAVRSMDPAVLEQALGSGKDFQIVVDGETLEVPGSAVKVNDTEEKVVHENYTPHVIEPSFGIDRLMVAVLEHSYFEAEKSPMKDEAEDEEGPYRVLRLDPRISPVKCGVFPLMNKDGLPEIARDIEKALKKAGLTTYFDHSRSIGRRYARMDEIGTPFSITVDYDSRTDNAVTVRFRDTGEQIRVPIAEVVSVVLDLLE
jgi:glycyl-tRNA synthetase